MDGEWEAPLIPNPLCESAPGCGEWSRPLIENPGYKGKWRPPLIDNPNYKGKWYPRRIPNPDFFEDLQPFLMAPIVSQPLSSCQAALIKFLNFVDRVPLVLSCGP